MSLRRWVVALPTALFSLALVLAWPGSSFGKPPPAKKKLPAKPTKKPSKRPAKAATATTAAPAAQAGSEGAPPPVSRNNKQSAIGSNVSPIWDWSTEWPFVDAFRTSRPWISGTAASWEDQQPLDLDSSGWVKSLKKGQIAHTLMFWKEDGPHYPEGEYTVLYEGEGELKFSDNVKVVSSRPGRRVIRPDTKASGIGIDLVATNPRNYIRNIHVLMPGGVCSNDGLKACRADNECGDGGKCVPFERNYKSQIFNPMFLDRLKTYSTIRVMNWMVGECDPNQKVWDDRPKLTDARWANKGVPIEVIVGLANRLGADPWITIPHLASDPYVRELAKYVRDHLGPDLRVYVEHSNEVWNDLFVQAEHAKNEGMRLRLSSDADIAKAKFHSRRSVRLFKLWEEVFKGRDRLVRVMGAFAGVTKWSEAMLTFESAYKSTDAVAIAPYIVYGSTPEQAELSKTMDLDALFEQFREVALKESIRQIEEHAELAKKYKVKLVAYEGGQDLLANDDYREDAKINALYDAANHDARMKDVYLAYFDEWKKKGGALFMHYLNCLGSSKTGRYGALEALDQPRSEAPKFDAVQEFIEKNPRWW